MAKEGGGCQGWFARGRFTKEEMEVLSGLVADNRVELATLNRKATGVYITSIFKGCRAKGMNRSRQQIYAKVKAILGSDKGKATLQQPQQKRRRQAQRVSGAAAAGVPAAVHLEQQQASQLQAIKKVLQQGNTSMLQAVEKVVKQHADTVQDAVKQILQQGQTTLDQVAAQQAAVQKATVEALEQGQDLLEIASAKQAAMHSAVEHALEQGQSALELASARHESVHLVVENALQQVAVQQAAIQAVVEQVAAQQAAIQAAVEQAALHEAQQGQAALLDLLPAVGAPLDEAALQQEPEDINLDLGL